MSEWSKERMNEPAPGLGMSDCMTKWMSECTSRCFAPGQGEGFSTPVSYDWPNEWMNEASQSGLTNYECLNKDGMIDWINVWISEWMNVWMRVEWLIEWMSEWANRWTFEWGWNDWLNECVNEWMSEWVNEWMSECFKEHGMIDNDWLNECVNEWTDEYLNEDGMINWMNERMSE